jgi:UDP-3-O-[3-hydroxymyristoyl] glucosamine N-acyltransferase
VIKKNTVIEANSSVGCNCTIGGVGFGYEKNSDGDFELIPHIGNVVLKNNVEVGNNTTIDRAVLGSAILHENVKVDNLVHIAHGVQIGRNSMIIANFMIAGSVIIGENSWIAPSSSILYKVVIEENVTVGLGAVVLKNVPKGDVIVGNPGRKLNK